MKNYIVGTLLILSFASGSVFAVTRAAEEKTAEDQGQTEKDTEITRTIRQRLVADESLSVKAHNVKIISEQGRIILRGPVDSSNEKAKVEKIAKSVAGNLPVTNETVISK